MVFVSSIDILTWLFAVASADSSYTFQNDTPIATVALTSTDSSYPFPLFSTITDPQTLTRPDYLVAGGDNPYASATYTSVWSYCSSSYHSEFLNWAAHETYFTSTLSDTDGPYYTDTEAHSEYTAPIPKTPCCLNCTLSGGDVQVYWWPKTTAGISHATQLINSANFTFHSPSIYVAFNSLFATNLCGHEGKDILRTTLAFDEGELSTASAFHYQTDALYHIDVLNPDFLDNTFTAATFGDTPCGNVTTIFRIDLMNGARYSTSTPLPSAAEAACKTEICNIQTFTMTYDPCSPTLSVPTQIFTLNPEWKTCIQGIDAFFDPPYTLQPGADLTTFQPAAAQTPAPVTSTAQPANTPVTPIASVTKAPETTAHPQPTNTPDPAPAADTSPAQDPTPVQSDDSPSSQDPSEADPAVSDSKPDDPPPSQAVSSAGGDSNQPLQDPAFDPSPTQTDHSSGNSPANQQDPVATTALPVIIGSQIITPGSPAVIISSKTYSIPTNNPSSIVLINNTPNPIPTLSTYVLFSQTLIAGGAAITISSTIISLLSGGQSVAIGGTTTKPLAEVFTSQGIVVPTGTQTGVGGAIISLGGFNTGSSGAHTTAGGGGGANGTGFGGVTFEGEGVNLRDTGSFNSLALCACIIIAVIFIL